MTTKDLDRSAHSLFASLEPQPADALLALISLHAIDPRETKIDLGVGVYRDAEGRTPVMRAVKAAETRLVAEQGSKSYLGAEGNLRFVNLLARVAFGEQLSAAAGLRGLQTPGGTGALRLAAELIARSNPQAQVWIGSPTWPNHVPIFAEAGLRTRIYTFFDPDRGTMDFDATMGVLAGVAAGDVVLLHGCCHNPTGADFSADQWREISGLLIARGAVPLVDFAYQGLGDDPDSDAAGMRHIVEAVPEALVAYSCNKNFGLYRERVGALWIKSDSEARAALAFGNLLTLARSLWSMPPDHGAAVVATILDDIPLAAMWRSELAEMRGRIGGLRSALGVAHPRLAPLAVQKGLFALLPIAPEKVAELRVTDGIYMAGSGRINIAGLQQRTIPTFVAAIAPLLERGPALAEIV